MSEVLRYIPYVLLFMVATMLIYGWGPVAHPASDR